MANGLNVDAIEFALRSIITALDEAMDEEINNATGGFSAYPDIANKFIDLYEDFAA